MTTNPVGNSVHPNSSAPPASLGMRFLAWFIDATICFVPAAAAFFVLVYVTFRSTWFFDGSSFIQVVGKGTDLVATYPGEYFHIPLLTLAIWALVAVIVCVLGGSNGQTLGRKTVGIRLISQRTGRAIGGGPALLRGAAFNVIAAVPVLGWILHLTTILNDSQERQGLHDRLTDAEMVPADANLALARVQEATARPAPDAGRTQQAAPAWLTGEASAPWEQPAPRSDETQIMSSPLARSLDAPPPVSAPPAPLPAWLDRSPPAAPAPTTAPARPAAPVAPEIAAPPTAPEVPISPPPTPATSEPAAPAAPAAASPSQIDDEVEMTRLVRPGQARRAYRPTAPDPVQARIGVSDGQIVDIRGTTLVGRNPAPRPGERAVTLLSVKDPERSVSKTHIILGLDARGLWMADRTSTNGSVVTLADGQQIVCMPEQQVRVTPGAKIQIGNVVITVLPV